MSSNLGETKGATENNNISQTKIRDLSKKAIAFLKTQGFDDNDSINSSRLHVEVTVSPLSAAFASNNWNVVNELLNCDDISVVGPQSVEGFPQTNLLVIAVQKLEEIQRPVVPAAPNFETGPEPDKLFDERDILSLWPSSTKEQLYRIIEKLIQKCPPEKLALFIQSVSYFGGNLLQHVAMNGDLRILNMLIANRLDINAHLTQASEQVRWAGDTALITAAMWSQNPEIVRTLLANGANIDARNTLNNTALEIMREITTNHSYDGGDDDGCDSIIPRSQYFANHEIILKMLEDASELFALAQTSSNRRRAEELLSFENASLNQRNQHGQTPWHVAQQCNQRRMMDLFASLGASNSAALILTASNQNSNLSIEDTSSLDIILMQDPSNDAAMQNIVYRFLIHFFSNNTIGDNIAFVSRDPAFQKMPDVCRQLIIGYLFAFNPFKTTNAAIVTLSKYFFVTWDNASFTTQMQRNNISDAERMSDNHVKEGNETLRIEISAQPFITFHGSIQTSSMPQQGPMLDDVQVTHAARLESLETALTPAVSPLTNSMSSDTKTRSESKVLTFSRAAPSSTSSSSSTIPTASNSSIFSNIIARATSTTSISNIRHVFWNSLKAVRQQLQIPLLQAVVTREHNNIRIEESLSTESQPSLNGHGQRQR